MCDKLVLDLPFSSFILLGEKSMRKPTGFWPVGIFLILVGLAITFSMGILLLNAGMGVPSREFVSYVIGGTMTTPVSILEILFTIFLLIGGVLVVVFGIVIWFGDPPKKGSNVQVSSSQTTIFNSNEG